MKKENMKKKLAKKGGECFCPYCEEELILEGAPFCAACKLIVIRCTRCLTVVVDKEAKTCPMCGEPLE